MVAEAFSSPDEEYRAGLEGAILVDRSYRGRVGVWGRDSVSFLHNMLSNDIKALTPGSGVYAGLLSPKGKLLADVVVYRLEDSLVLELEPERIATLIETLSRHVVSEDVHTEDVSDQEILVSIEGPRAAEILSLVSGEPPLRLPLHNFRVLDLDRTAVRVSAARHGPGPGFDLAVPEARTVALLDRILEAGRDLGLRLAGHRTQEIRRIEAGIPLYGVDMDDSRLILEAGLEEAVSFEKGCYMGQEYVARLAHRGHLNRRLVGLKLDGSTVPRRGDEIIGDGAPAGYVTSAAPSPLLGHPIALGYVGRRFFAPGTLVSVRCEAEDVPARVSNVPFVAQR